MTKWHEICISRKQLRANKVVFLVQTFSVTYYAMVSIFYWALPQVEKKWDFHCMYNCISQLYSRKRSQDNPNRFLDSTLLPMSSLNAHHLPHVCHSNNPSLFVGKSFAMKPSFGDLYVQCQSAWGRAYLHYTCCILDQHALRSPCHVQATIPFWANDVDLLNFCHYK